MKGFKLGIVLGAAAVAAGVLLFAAVRWQAAFSGASAAPPAAQASAPAPAADAVGFDSYFGGLGASNAEMYTVQAGDTLTKIAKRYNVTPGLILASNGLKNDAINPGMKLKIMKERWRLLIDKSAFTLELLAENTPVKTYRVGLGKDSSTPVGEFKILNRLKNPTWYHEGKVLPSGNPENPLGSRWMGFDIKSYGLHGTIDPASIGKSESLGCIRMMNADVEELFELVPVGTPVRIVESRAAGAMKATS